MNPQNIARVAGLLFVITFLTSIPPALFLYGPVLDEPRYILGGGAADKRCVYRKHRTTKLGAAPRASRGRAEPMRLTGTDTR